MTHRIVVLSGPVVAGKTTLATSLSERYSMHVFKTREEIRSSVKSAGLDRHELQVAGAMLDDRTGGRWVAEAVARMAIGLSDSTDVIVDSARILEQIEGLRAAFGAGRVVHIHLTAPDAELKKRYQQRKGVLTELPSYADVKAHATEQQVEQLASSADVVIDTKRCSRDDVVVRAASHLGLFGRQYSKLVDVLVGGQWGSEGKGHLASYLAPEYDILVRVGGPNAGHKVYRKTGPITFRHLPSGSLECEARVVIGAGAVLGLPTLLEEIANCRLSTDRLVVDPNAMIIDDADVSGEKQALTGIGSTHQGVGLATARKVQRSAAQPPVRLARDVDELRPFIASSVDVLDDAFRNNQRVLLEGTQGTGLSLHHGDYPFVTSRDTTASGCLAEAGIPPARVRRTIMLVRAYPIRVGGQEHSGPMGLELTWSEISRRSDQPADKLRRHERTTTTNRSRRVAEFSWTMLRRAASLNGPTDVALSFADYIDKRNEHARRFEQLTDETIYFVEEIERVTAAPVSLIVTRFNERSVIDRRAWGHR